MYLLITTVAFYQLNNFRIRSVVSGIISFEELYLCIIYVKYNITHFALQQCCFIGGNYDDTASLQFKL